MHSVANSGRRSSETVWTTTSRQSVVATPVILLPGPVETPFLIVLQLNPIFQCRLTYILLSLICRCSLSGLRTVPILNLYISYMPCLFKPIRYHVERDS